MKTKEQILDQNGFDFDAFEYENEYSAKSLLNSMQLFANQEVKAAIEKRDKEILEWIEKNETELREMLRIKQFITNEKS